MWIITQDQKTVIKSKYVLYIYCKTGAINARLIDGEIATLSDKHKAENAGEILKKIIYEIENKKRWYVEMNGIIREIEGKNERI